MTERCNNTSVGVILEKDDSVLLIERQKFPFGIACPAGHVDIGETYEEAATREVKEEVGLDIYDLEEVFSKKINNLCRRPGGDYHNWKVYKAKFDGDILLEKKEAKRFIWLNTEEIEEISKRTLSYKKGNIKEEDWIKSPGIESVWVDILREINKSTM